MTSNLRFFIFFLFVSSNSQQLRSNPFQEMIGKPSLSYTPSNGAHTHRVTEKELDLDTIQEMARNEQTSKSISISSEEKLINLAQKPISSGLAEHSGSKNNDQNTKMEKNKTPLPLSESDDELEIIGCTNPRHTPSSLPLSNSDDDVVFIGCTNPRYTSSSSSPSSDSDDDSDDDDVVFIGCTKPRYTPTEMARSNKEARRLAKAEARRRRKASSNRPDRGGPTPAR